jgi:transcriptional regulator with XRE-family HTH domain
MADTDREARERFAANVERLRRRKGMSAESLAERSGIDAGELDEILRADREPGYEAIARLSGALGVEPEELFEGIGWIPGDEVRPGRFEVERPDGPGD